MAFLSDVGYALWMNLPGLLCLALVSHLAWNYFTAGAVSVPGPFLAKLTNVWRFFDVAKGRTEKTLYALHNRYGDYVRLGPNVVSVRNLDAVKTIYGIKGGYRKTNFYRVQQHLARGKPTTTLFTVLDEDLHARIKRPVSSAYSMSTLTEFEPFVDKTISIFFSRLDEFVERREVCDIAAWLQYCMGISAAVVVQTRADYRLTTRPDAFDVIGELTFSKPLGFLDQGRDVDGIIAALSKTLDYAGKIGQMPWLDYLFVKNPLRQLLSGGATTPIARFARARMDERLKQDTDQSSATWQPGQTSASQELPGRRPRDFLTRFLEAQREFPEVVDDAQVFSYTVSNVNAGSDTTAISLRAILYYVLKHGSVRDKLTAELESAYASGAIESLPVSWKQSQELPYLDAVIKEALRLHPAVGMLLERLVPENGLQLPGGGPFLPAGTIVGANAWIMHRMPAIFGADVDSFVPERWLRAPDEPDAKYQSRRQGMLRATFTFGAGSRTCIGKNISLLEIYKLIPSLFLAYKMELKNPDAEWALTNAWFVRQKNMDIWLGRRALDRSSGTR